MGAFSGVIKLSDINDFIAPSQACVVNLQGQKAPQAEPRREVRRQTAGRHCPGRVGRKIEGRAPAVQADRPQRGPGFSQTSTAADGAVKVSLHDCLACSGCVTSAESVLLEHQSLEELAAKLRRPGLVVVASLSPQSRASLAKALGLAPLELQGRLAHFLKSLGVAHVFDTCSSRDLSLMASADEFLQRKRGPAAASSPGAGVRAASVVLSLLQSVLHGHESPLCAGAALPMLASACPGWVCYAEKTHGSFILPYISTAKSPQVRGALFVPRAAPGRGRRATPAARRLSQAASSSAGWAAT